MLFRSGRAVAERAVVLFRLGGPDPSSPAESSAMLTRLICQDLLAAGAALNGIGVDGDGIVWLSECGCLPRPSVIDLIARGPGTGLPVLAATTSAQVAGDLADLVNVVVAYRMKDAAAAHRLSEVTGAAQAGPGRPAEPGAGATPGVKAGPGPAADLSALRDGEFLLAVKNPPRLVSRGLLVRARVPPIARGGGPAAPPQQAWESTRRPPAPPGCAWAGNTRRHTRRPGRRRAGPHRRSKNGSTRTGRRPSAVRRACSTGRSRRCSPSP